MDFSTLVETRPLVVGDGAMGTQLMARGLAAGRCCELWNVENPQVVQAVQREYVEAGADLLLTNTFGGNPVALARHGLADRTEELNGAAAAIARRAADGRALVVGDIGPTGSLLAPLGELSVAEARDAFRRQAEALVGAGVDAVLCETFQSGDELRAALEAARECTDLPLIASMTFSPEPSGRYRSIMGEAPEAVVGLAERFACAACGTNCGQGIETMAPLIGQLADLTDLPVIAQPNAGLPRLVGGRAVYEQAPSVFALHVVRLYESGARIIGGCDGTTAQHVRALRLFADSL